MSFPFSYPISIPRGLTLTFRKTAFIWIITNLFFSKNQSCKDPIRGPQLLNSAVTQPVLLLMLLQHQEFEGWKRQATGYLLQVVFGVLAILSKKLQPQPCWLGTWLSEGNLLYCILGPYSGDSTLETFVQGLGDSIHALLSSTKSLTQTTPNIKNLSPWSTEALFIH